MAAVLLASSVALALRAFMSKLLSCSFMPSVSAIMARDSSSMLMPSRNTVKPTAPPAAARMRKTISSAIATFLPALLRGFGLSYLGKSIVVYWLGCAAREL